MSFITNVACTPNRVEAILNFLRFMGNTPTDLDLLERVVSPPSIRLKSQNDEEEKDPDEETGNTSTLDVRKVVNEMLALGMLKREDSKISFSPYIESKKSNLEILEKVMYDESKHQYFLEMLTWYACQKPLSENYPFTWTEVEKQTPKEYRREDWGKMNDARFGQFTHWVVYLGLGERIAKGSQSRFFFNPANFIKREIGNYKPETEKKLRLSEVMRFLANKNPIFEGNALRRRWEEKLNIVREPNVLSESTSLAFFLLQEKGEFKLTHESDSPESYVLIEPQGGRLVVSSLDFAGKEA